MQEVKSTEIESLQLVLNNIPGSHLILSPDGPSFTIIAATDAYLHATYTSRDEIIGLPVFQVFTDNLENEKGIGAQNLRASLEYVVRAKQTHVMPDTRYDVINRKTGQFEFKIWKPTNKPVFNNEGRIQVIIHTVEDITEQVRLLQEGKETRQQLEESEIRFWKMMEKAPVAMLLSRGEEIVIEAVNEPMLAYMRKSSISDVLGKRMVEVFPEIADQSSLKMALSVQRTGIPHKGEEVALDFLVHGQLERHYFNLSYTPVLEGGQVVGVLHVAVDVTHQVEKRMRVEENETLLQKKVSERTQALENKNRELEQFTYAASHDLQEPLRKIATFTSMLLQNNASQLDARGELLLTKINNSASRMKSIIDDLLLYSHRTREEQPMVSADLNELLNAIKEELDLVIEQKGAVITTENLPVLKAVPNQLHQLFFNLIMNALKFSKPEQQPKLLVRASRFTDEVILQKHKLDASLRYVLIEVIDNGIGFDQQYAEHIFELFKRLHGKNEYQGTGIGLALCKKVVENHGGAIWAESEIGVGSVFKILLPM